MIAKVRSVDFLPEIFQTPVNKQFLSATLDQLIQEPQFKISQGYIGHKVGPGVQPADYYVTEPTQERADYQLEPGVVSLDPITGKYKDSITYPGIIDALKLQGAYTNNASRLFQSEYYSWDPFVDFDKMVNYSQYYWLPDGPLSVDVSATLVPTTDSFNVTRANGAYTIEGYAGTNPAITLVRNGSYQFNVAQNDSVAVDFRVQNNGSRYWIIDYANNPTLTLVRGNTYTFNLSLDGFYPFYIKTAETYGTTNLYDTGVTNNGASTGLITFTVPQDAPDTLYYVNPAEFNLRGTLTIVDAQPGTGPGFWIQAAPGIDGVLPWSRNISSRDVLGVSNNGTDLGTVTFNVPDALAQSFYTSMPSIGPVDLIVNNLQFNQINGESVAVFLAANPTGIDGVTNLNGRTLVFTTQITDPQDGGWVQDTPFDPLAQSSANNGLPGSYDSITYDQATYISDTATQYSVWQIQYVNDANGVPFMQLNSILPISNLNQFNITYGTQYVNTNWYKNSSGFFQEMPLLTATLDTLYYQDGTDPEIFGVINLINGDLNATINVTTDILGQKTYTSPNGVTFTNGLKVTFRGNVTPSSYVNETYYVNGVGSSITLTSETVYITPEPSTTVVSVGYSSTPYDTTWYDQSLNQPIEPDYMTINMASIDLNPWTRGNRWFHIDVIRQAAAYNNTEPLFVNAQRAKRPILEFRAGTKLFNFGTEGIPPVSIIDFTQTDALSNVNGQTGYGIDGYPLQQNSLVIFAADTNPAVRNQVYQVNFIVPDPLTSTVPIIDLVPTSYSPVLANQTTVCLSGTTLQGVSFYFDGDQWIRSQQKTQANQPPLFDVYDSNGVSFGDSTYYPSTNFTGSKLFSYAEDAANSVDPVLGIPLAYFSLNNIGDIQFTNNLYTDTFTYTPTTAGVTVEVSTGFVRQYSERLVYVREIGWQTAAIPSTQRQQFQFSYDTTPLQLDILVQSESIVPPVQIFINNVYQTTNTYTVSTNTTTNTTMITLTGSGYVLGDIIEVLVLSEQTSSQGFYQVPVNLENNPFNANSTTFTLGSARSHYGTICENLIGLRGPINGANNTRDLGDIVPYGQQILQQSAPMTLGGYFLRSHDYSIWGALEFNSREYIKYKNKLLTAVTQLDIDDQATVAQILDDAILQINLNLTSSSPFYWSDMLPSGTNYTSTSTTVNPITGQTFNTLQTYDFTKSNYLGLLVYLNGDLLLRGTDYIVSTDTPRLTILIPLTVGDVVTINEYTTTVGNWCPNTPSKMGLYPKYRPEIFLDETYTNPAYVIRGHDGSLTVAFEDIRDLVLLEFEKRIYDNIKVDDNPIPLSTEEVTPNFFPAQTTSILPGFFRTTPYTYDEVNTILGESFLTWVGQNNLDYTAQDYQANNPFTYNYSQSGNRLNEAPLLGNWRGIYRYFYDTETPNTTPWEMLGFSEMPAWWELRYGPAPYTNGNMVLWDDLEIGLVANPANPYILVEYARPGLSKIIPTGSEGELLSPIGSLIGLYDDLSFKKSWVNGDGGPVQASWWKSSSYPFAIMRLLALTKPAEFFSLYADRDLYRYDTDLGQFLYNGRYRLNASGVQIYGNGVSKASYINWIVDYNRQLGINSTDTLTAALANLDVRLCYRMASFSDPTYLALYAERSGPGSTNNSLLIPPESYNLVFYKNQPFEQITYSALVIEQTPLGASMGYSVFGYSNMQPYFNVQVSSPVGLFETLDTGNLKVQVPTQYTQNVAQVPYGYTFTNAASVCDFILGYGTFLERQGLVFDDRYNGYELNWKQMALEFLNFASQGWAPNTMVNLNPVATTIKSTKPVSIVDTIASLTPENMLLDQYSRVLEARTMIINRDGNTFSLTTTTGQTISFLTLRFTNYEDMVVLDNTTQYNDLIYDPTTGARQARLSLNAFVSTEWDGQLNAQGFILNLNNIEQWASTKKYTKGEIVLYKNTYWQAMDIVQPTEDFNYNQWVKSDYQLIDRGLLPNLANKADQLANTYSIYDVNLASDNDLFAFGLIGFRPRQYMSDLNLDSVTQVQLYQQFLGTKGTRRAAELFTRADLGKESGDYKIYENWAVLAGTYGAQANKSFFELNLNEAFLKSNPSTVQVINPGEASEANQTIYLENVWKESYKLTSPNIMPTIYESGNGFPTAGYVCLDDVDLTVFDIKDPTAIDADIDNIGIGTYIWIAKINSYNWGVYRTNKVNGQLSQLSDNYDGTSVATFTTEHNLSVGDTIIIRGFNTSVNGVYRVLSVPSITTITISFAFVNTNQTTVSGTGIVYYLQSARVSEASDIATLPYVNRLIPGEKVWVDNNGSGQWEVLEKQQPFTLASTLTPGLTATGKYGSSIAQTTDSFAAIVGAPGANNGAGYVYTYVRDPNLEYTYSETLSLDSTGTEGFGSVVYIGNKNWGAAGASLSNNGAGYVAVLYRDSNSSQFAITQLLVSPDEDFSATGFGSAITVSNDERWMYVTAPAINTVYAYERVDVVTQTATYTTNGVTNAFNYSNNIQIDYTNPGELLVMLGNRIAVLNSDYTVTNTSVIFALPPSNNQQLVITRKESAQFDQTFYYGVQQDSIVGTGIGAVFTVNNTRGEYYVTLEAAGQNYGVGDILTVNYTQVEPSGNSSNNLTITVVDINSDGGIFSYTSTGTGITNTSVFTLNTLLYNATSINSFSVFVDNVVQRPYIDYTFNATTTDITFIANPVAGAKIVVTAGTSWQYVDTITNPASTVGDTFGASITTTTDGRQIIIGAPKAEGEGIIQAGQVYAYDRSVISYLVTNTTQTTYAIVGTATDPIAVSVNGQFLLSIEQSTTGQYTVSGSNIIFSNIEFTLGDVIDIETNQFQLIQQFSSDTPTYEAQYGTAVDACPLNCSFYVGAPFDSTYIPQAGSVDHQVNQSRVYGVTTSTIANPTLTVGDTIRINDTVVAVPAPTSGGGTNTIQSLISAINAAAIPNAIAVATPNLEFAGDSVTTAFSIGALYSAASSYTTVVYVNNILQAAGADYTYDSATQQIFFTNAPLAGTVITVVSGRMTVSVQNAAAADPSNLITVLPGVNGSAFDDLGFNTFVFTQQILSPAPVFYGQFGASLSIDTSATNLIVGAPNGNVYEPTTFDAGQTYFDDYSTTFYNPVNNGGVAYTYDYFPSSTQSILTPGQFAFGQQIYNDVTQTGDQFGVAVNYTSGRLMVGAIGNASNTNYGYATVFRNYTNAPAWAQIRIQQPVVNVHQLNSVFMYNKLLNSTQTYFDFFDPLQGKILGAARRNIDYLGAVDPASYNVGTIHNNGNQWGSEHIGEIWWDTDTVRFIDPNQDDIVYASRKWGSTFPGSRVDIYQWVESTVPPASYTGVGTPLSNTSYTVGSALGQNNVFTSVYYFWVRNIVSIAEGSGKTLSTVGIASYITDPRNSGIPYIAALNASTVALYNAGPYISAETTILSIGFDRTLTENNIHQEYELIAEGVADAFLNANLYRKFQDSLCGVDTAGNVVPDPTLTKGEQYGVQFRPRQSMFADRFAALQNYLGRANTVLAQYPIVEMRSFNLLNAAEPVPNSTQWNLEVANLEILAFQNLAAVPVGYKYLVLSDSSQDGRWTIYEVSTTKTLVLLQVQSYDTPLYWYYTNWYRPGYNSSTATRAAVQNYSGLATLTYTTVPVGASARVINNGSGKYEIYLRTGFDPVTDWQRVGLEDGTIQFKEELWNYSLGGFGFDAEVFDAQYFDQEPAVETRYIIQALNEEIYTDELLIERNNSLMLMFDFVYSEFTSPDWLIKTSLVDISHKIRSLLPYQTYIQDNQNFVLDYFNEVKPYHVQVRQFNLIYTGDDTFQGDITDYDVPAYYDSALDIPQFVSPILTPYDVAQTSTHYNTYSDAAPDAQIWLTSPWSEWYNNYLLSIQGATVVNGGTGYTVTPTVEVSGTCITPAVMTAVINSAGQVIGINIVSPGLGYSTTAIITIIGGNGTGAVAVAQMGNNLVRSIKTVMKYDRYQYSSTIVDWATNTTYTTGTQVRYDAQVWEAIATVTNSIFDPDQWNLVDPSTLSGVDRTMGMYVPTPNLPGLSLPLLIDGIEYPGVQVTGVSFADDTGYARGGFDDTSFDNYFVGPDGRVTYDPSILNTIYASNYQDTFLGTRPTDINVDGGAYVDTYSSHAPEELVPGAMFDTLDMRVYTTPGADWLGTGHGFPEHLERYTYTTAQPTISFANIMPFPALFILTDETAKADLHEGVDYTVDWENLTFTIIANVANNSTIGVYVYEFGGGNQLYKNVYNGADVGDTIIVPVQFSLINEFVVFVNGVQTTDYVFTDNGNVTYNTTLLTFGTTYTSTDFISLAVIAPTTIDNVTTDYSWSIPVTQTITGVGGVYTYDLDNSLDYTNAVNAVVTVNGVRARTAAGIDHVGDGTTFIFAVASRLGFDQATIILSEVSVYFDDIQQTSGYFINPLTAGTTVQFSTPPLAGTRIYIAVATGAQAVIDPIAATVTFDPTGGLVPGNSDTIAVVTFNDTRQQRLITEVFVGPVDGSVIIEIEGYDTTPFDEATVNNTPGSYNYTVGTTDLENELALGRVVTDSSRLWVSLNGQWLSPGTDFTLYNGPDSDDPYNGTEIILSYGILQPTDVVMVTIPTEIVVPEAMEFRIFQDMRGVQTTYRMTPATTTTVVQAVTATADIIYVADASELTEPNFVANVWGVVTIDGERIMYRERNTTNNTISSLLRGTAGTGADSHAVGANVYDLGSGNTLAPQYQNYIVSDTTLANGTQTVFTATDVSLDYTDAEGFDFLPFDVGTVQGDPGSYDYGIGNPALALEVYVGGTLQLSGYTVIALKPAEIEFDVAPPAGADVTMLVRRGVTWYQQGLTTASNGEPLQETNTPAARFLRGL